MIKLRFGVFETNSSSTHVMVLSPETPIFKDFLNGKAFLVEDCPSWLKDHIVTSGSGNFIRIDKLVEVIEQQPKNVRREFLEFIADAKDDEYKDDTERLARECNAVYIEGEFFYVRDVSVFDYGDKLSIDVGDTKVTALGVEIED